MKDFVKDNLKEGLDDSVKTQRVWLTEKEAIQTMLAQMVTLIVLLVLAIVTPFTFTNMVLFLVLVELVAIKDTLRRGLTRQF